MKRALKSLAAAVLSFATVSSAVMPAASEIVPAARHAITAHAAGSFTLENGVLTISGSPTLFEVWKYNKDESITKIVVEPDTVLPEDCCEMFGGTEGRWKNVKEIDMSRADTYYVTNMLSMFKGLASLEVVRMNRIDTRNVTSMQRMFQGCAKLTYADLSFTNTKKLTDTEEMFWNCKSLTSLDLGSIETQNVTSMKNMFTGCSSLVSLDLSNFNTRSVTNMNEMFNGCTSLETLDVSGFNTANVTEMRYMFQNCEKLGVLHLGGFNTGNVTDMFYMFNGCKALYDLDVTGFNTSKLSDTINMFAGCESLTSLDISSFDTHAVTQMTRMFAGDRSLKKIIVGDNWSTASVVYSGNMFDNCVSLVGDNGTQYKDSNPKDKTYACVDGGGIPGYLSGALTNCCSFDESTGTLTLKERIYPETVKKYSGDDRVKKVVAEAGALLPRDCSSLFKGFRAETIDLSQADSSRAATMGAMFSGCYNLKKLNISGFNTSEVTTMSYMFSGCRSLTMLDLSSFNTRNVSLLICLFQNCSSLKTILIGNDWYIKNPKNAIGVFEGCTSLVGGAGTVFDSSNIHGTYAHKDGGEEDPGYLTMKDISFKTNSMTLGGSIALNFYVSLVGVPEDKLSSTKADFTVNGKKYTAKFNKNKKNSRGYYGFTCPLDAVSMADEVQAVLTYYGPDGKKATLSTVSTAETYLNKFNENDRVELWNIIQAINDFGYYMQLYLSAHSGKPWTLGVDHAAMKKAYMSKSDMNRLNGTYTEILAKYKKTKKVNSDIKNIQYSLILDSDTYINFKITKSDSYKGNVKVMLDDKEVTPKTLSDGRLQVTVSGIGAKQLATSHTVKVITGSKTASFTASALSYAYDCVSDPKYPDTEPYAMIALYQYYKAAVEYK